MVRENMGFGAKQFKIQILILPLAGNLWKVSGRPEF